MGTFGLGDVGTLSDRDGSSGSLVQGMMGVGPGSVPHAEDLLVVDGGKAMKEERDFAGCAAGWGRGSADLQCSCCCCPQDDRRKACPLPLCPSLSFPFPVRGKRQRGNSVC